MDAVRRRFALGALALAIGVGILVGPRIARRDASPPAPGPSATNSGQAPAPSLSVIPYLPTRRAPDDSPGPMTVVERELTLLRPRFKECYRQTIDGGVRVSGRAVLGVMIRKDGSVEDVSVVEDSGLGTGLLGCITQAIKTYRFVPPEDGGTASFRVPLEFHPADGG